MWTPEVVEPFREPWQKTAVRTVSLAVIAGVIAGLISRRFTIAPLVALLALWFTLGGHFIELLFRNRLGSPLRGGPMYQVARLVFWFVGGCLLYGGVWLTAKAITGHAPAQFPWWGAGLGFAAAELLIHLRLREMGQPCFYDGRG
jgi:hypothetical protein